MSLRERGCLSALLVLAFFLLMASPAAADAVITLDANADYTHIFKNGTTPFTATVGNDSAASENLDWAVDNNGTTGLTLSGSGTNLVPGGTVNVAGTYTGASYGTFDVQAQAAGTVSGGGTATNSPVLSSAVSITVGYALAANSYTPGSYTSAQFQTFGTPLYTTVAPSASYAGLSVKVLGLAGGGSNYVGTEMVFRAGSNTGPTTTVISMAFRNRTDIEVNAIPYILGHSQSLSNPPVAYDSYGLISDVANVTGVTGIFVLQSDYDENTIIYTNPTYTEAEMARLDYIYLGWFEPGPGGVDPEAAEWTHATEGNNAIGSKAVFNYQGSWDDFIAETAHSDWETNLNAYLGSYGVDYIDNTVWAVLDHNSAFSVVPEPATVGLLALGGLATLMRRRR